VPSLRHTNKVIGAYVTAGARIHLYGFLDQLQEKAIYTDTDSVILIQPGPKSEPTPIETGDNLGQMQSEFKKDEIIVEVVLQALKITRTRRIIWRLAKARPLVKLGVLHLIIVPRNW